MQISRYEPGMLKVVTPEGVQSYRNNDDTAEWPPPGLAVGEFYLPHSCDEWVIGDRAAAIALLRDLTHLLGGMTYAALPPDRSEP